EIVFDRVAEKLVQMRAARPEAHDLAVMVAREHEIVTIAEGEPEARRGAGRADLEPAHMSDGAQRTRDIKPERAVAWPRKQVLDPHAREGLCLLLHQRFDRALDLHAILDVDEAHLADLAETPELLALLLAGLGRALLLVVVIPVAAERRHMRAARIGKRRKGKERMAGAADALRHLLQVNKVEAQAPISSQEAQHLAPQLAEVVDMTPEVARQQRCVVVAQLRPEPGQPSDRSTRFDREREDEQER